MKTNRLAKTLSITPTPHISFPIDPLLLSEKMFTSLDLSSLFSPLKKKGIDICTLIKALTACKLSDNFSIKCAHSWLMQPETREYYDLLIPSQSYEFAIDITNDLYYGEIDETNQINVISGQTKKSTHTFYVYISPYIITKNTQLILAVYPVQKGGSQLDYVKKCVQTIIKKCNIKIFL